MQALILSRSGESALAPLHSIHSSYARAAVAARVAAVARRAAGAAALPRRRHRARTSRPDPSSPLPSPPACLPAQVAGYKVKCMMAEPKTRRGAGDAAYLQGLAARGAQVLPQVRRRSGGSRGGGMPWTAGWLAGWLIAPSRQAVQRAGKRRACRPPLCSRCHLLPLRRRCRQLHPCSSPGPCCWCLQGLLAGMGMPSPYAAAAANASLLSSLNPALVNQG